MDLHIVRGSNCPQEQIKFRMLPNDNNLDEAKLLTPCYNYALDPNTLAPACTDNDCDDYISIFDALNVLDILTQTFPACGYNDDFDVDGDGSISILDALFVLDQLTQTCGDL